mmetsp:Transcript_41645/g.114894  ORF Transcript_41645/g.114894 Transcript_41645/m.114894 type:complete len:316 (-) Transcript_41645:171-1118(-)
MGGQLRKVRCFRRREPCAPSHAIAAALNLNVFKRGPSTPLSTRRGARKVVKRLKPDAVGANAKEGCALTLLPDDQVTAILAWLDMKTFALAVAPSCSLFSQAINSDSFEGWLCEIQRLLRLCPWTDKFTIETATAAHPDLQALRYCTALKSLDRELLSTGARIIPSELRSRDPVVLPPFLECHEGTMVYACIACASFISLVDITVGRGYMGMQHNAFILQPEPSAPFCCGIHDARMMRLSSGTYILKDLVCPNRSCDACLGWKYQECVPIDGHVPAENFRKIGQFWLYAASLKVVIPHGSSPDCMGEQFYFMSDF